MLNKKEIKDKHANIRNITVKLTGADIADVERDVVDIATSHIEALEEINRLKRNVTSIVKVVNNVVESVFDGPD